MKEFLVIECLYNTSMCSSIDDGTENPFRPDGELSKEADEIVNLIKGKIVFCYLDVIHHYISFQFIFYFHQVEI